MRGSSSVDSSTVVIQDDPSRSASCNSRTTDGDGATQFDRPGGAAPTLLQLQHGVEPAAIQVRDTRKVEQQPGRFGLSSQCRRSQPPMQFGSRHGVDRTPDLDQQHPAEEPVTSIPRAARGTGMTDCRRVAGTPCMFSHLPSPLGPSDHVCLRPRRPESLLSKSRSREPPVRRLPAAGCGCHRRRSLSTRARQTPLDSVADVPPRCRPNSLLSPVILVNCP